MADFSGALGRGAQYGSRKWAPVIFLLPCLDGATTSRGVALQWAEFIHLDFAYLNYHLEQAGHHDYDSLLDLIFSSYAAVVVTACRAISEIVLVPSRHL